ncbi:MAG TPA: NUDIX hydrolase [Xanthobacteraceae bacterium]|jgi:8-oxo-dGTP pyrophosphatase MutT (NUDIX family)|nr:NUDIX hydrolase [Xanthobacteraceae bacterium]
MSNELADWLTRVERDQTHPNQRPRDAATIILVDRSETVPKVLLGRRHANHKFMPGKFVFPGGRVEPSDRDVPIATELDPALEARLLRQMQRPSRAKARAFAVAAIRELFEETGLFLGKKDPAAAALAGGPLAAFAEAGVVPDLGALHFVARAITPPRRPKRFDTRFFAADATNIIHKIDGVIGPDAELVELVWLPVTEVKNLDMPTITKVVLIELEARTAAGFEHHLPSPFYRVLQRRFVRQEL